MPLKPLSQRPCVNEICGTYSRVNCHCVYLNCEVPPTADNQIHLGYGKKPKDEKMHGE